jgi:hypothetical protein
VGTNATFLDLLPASLQQPQTYVVLFLVVFILVLVAVVYNRNLTVSMFGRNLLDVQSKKNIQDKNKIDNKDADNPENKEPVTQIVPHQNPGRVSPHTGCPHANDFILVITETTDVVSEISEIRYKGCMSEQMFRADQHLIRLRTTLQNKYRKLLAKKSAEQEEISGANLVAYKFYQALTRIMIQDIKDLIIRIALLNNHLADFKSNAEFDVYIDRQFESVKTVICDTTIDMYMGDWIINQMSVMELHESTFPDLRDIVKDIFTDAKDIAIRSKNRITDLEKKLKDFVTKIAGING